MDMDDDFIGEVEFDLSEAQGETVNRAINLASSMQEADGFAHLNPLIAIMQWWETNVPETERTGVTPEARLVEACRRFLASHTR